MSATIVTTVTIPAGARMVDSAQRLTAAQIRSLGAVGTCRYYAPRKADGSRSWKCLTPGEIVELHAAGIAIVPNWESSATRPLSGAYGGSVDGHEFARQLVLDGVPDEALVIVSCDMNAVAGNRPNVESYFRLAFDELRRVGYRNLGAYGDTDLFAWLADLDLTNWLMVSPSFSNGARASTHIWQRYQGTWGQNVAGIPNNVYDPNDVLKPVAGVWLPHVVVEPPAHLDVIVDPPVVIPPHPTSKEFDMPYIIVAADRNPAIVDGQYATGICAATLQNATIPVMVLDDPAEWDAIVATSNAKKAHDAAVAGGAPVTFPQFPPFTVSLTGRAVPEAG